MLSLQVGKSWTTFEVFRFLEDFWRRLGAETIDVDSADGADDGKHGFLLNFQSQVSFPLLSCFECISFQFFCKLLSISVQISAPSRDGLTQTGGWESSLMYFASHMRFVQGPQLQTEQWPNPVIFFFIWGLTQKLPVSHCD